MLLAEAFYVSGLRRGDKIAIIGDNMSNLYLSIVSAKILVAIPVPCYQDSVASEIQYILEHAEAKLAVVENQEQVDKLLEIKGKLPLLKNIFYSDARGLEKYDEKEKAIIVAEPVLRKAYEIIGFSSDI